MSADYIGRNAILREMGFFNYAAYQESSLWAEIRLKVLTAARFRCQLYGRDARVVHHSRYLRENLSGESLKFLHPICHGCHHAVEMGPEQRKRSIWESIKEFDRLLADESRRCSKRELKDRKRRRKGKGKPWIGLAHKRLHMARRAGR